MAEEYLTVAEAAQVMHVHPQTAYRLVWAQKLPRINLGQGKRPRYRIRRSAVDRYMANREKGLPA